MGTNIQQDTDQAMANVATLAVAAFAVVTLSGVLHGRLATAIAANLGVNKQVNDESGVLMCIITASGQPPVWYTEAGFRRLELEASSAPGY